MKKSFLIHTDSLAVLEALTNEQAGELFKAIKAYQDGNEDIKLHGILQVAFIPFQKQFERDKEKYSATIERNKINGNKGGRPKKTQKTQSVILKPTETQKTQVVLKKPDNDSDSDNGSDNENENKKITNEYIVDYSSTDNQKPNSSFSKKQILPTEKKGGGEKPGAHPRCVSFWLDEFRKGWTFSGVHGKAIKSIIQKIEKVHNASGKEPTEELIVESFKAICLNLPVWFQDKDLQIIDSKFNEIITQIKENKNGISKQKQPISKYHN
jgi:hypothetical protein